MRDFKFIHLHRLDEGHRAGPRAKLAPRSSCHMSAGSIPVFHIQHAPASAWALHVMWGQCRVYAACGAYTALCLALAQKAVCGSYWGWPWIQHTGPVWVQHVNKTGPTHYMQKMAWSSPAHCMGCMGAV